MKLLHRRADLFGKDEFFVEFRRDPPADLTLPEGTRLSDIRGYVVTCAGKQVAEQWFHAYGVVRIEIEPQYLRLLAGLLRDLRLDYYRVAREPATFKA